MKKICILLALLLVTIVAPAKAIIADAIVNLNVYIDNSASDKIVVSIPDDNSYASLQPEIEVVTSFSKVKVEKDGVAVDYKIDDGVVTFTIDDYDCDYVISKVTSKAHKYTIPNTGIE